MSDESSVTGTLDPQFKMNGAKHERKQLVSSLIADYSCSFINSGCLVGLEDLVAAKDSS